MAILRPTLSQIQAAGDFATTFRWWLSIPLGIGKGPGDTTIAVGSDDGVPPAIPVPETLPPIEAIGPESVLNVLCESSDIPVRTQEKMTIQIRGLRHFQPTMSYPSDSINLNFFETIDSPIHRFFIGWQQKIWSKGTGKSKTYPELIIPSVVLQRLDQRDLPVCTYILENVFLQGITQPRLDSASSAPYSMGVSLAYDDFSVTLHSNGTTEILTAPLPENSN